MPPHPGGQMVQAEQVGQGGGLVGGPLHGVEHAQLPVQQRLVAQRQVEEDLVDALAQVGLAHRGLHRRPLHGLERVRHPGDLGDPARWRGRRLGLDVDLLAVPQPLHDVGQPFRGHLLRAVVQGGELTGQPAPEPQCQQDRRHHRHQAEAAGQHRFEQQPVTGPGAQRGQRRGRPDLRFLHPGQELPGHRLPGPDVHRDGRPAADAPGDPVLQHHELPVRARVVGPGPRAAQLCAERAERVTDEQPLVGHGAGEQLTIAGAHLTVRRRRPTDQGRLPAGVLQRPGRIDAGVRLVVHHQLVALVRRAVDVEQGVHDLAVGLERGRRAEYPGIGRGPQPGQVVQQ